MERTWRLPMVTQPVCRPKKVLEQQSRLPTSRPPTSARTVSTGSPPFPEQPSACLPRAQSTASAHGHEAQPRSPGQYIACLGSTERRLRHQTPDLPTLNSCAFQHGGRQRMAVCVPGRAPGRLLIRESSSSPQALVLRGAFLESVRAGEAERGRPTPGSLHMTSITGQSSAPLAELQQAPLCSAPLCRAPCRRVRPIVERAPLRARLPERRVLRCRQVEGRPEARIEACRCTRQVSAREAHLPCRRQLSVRVRAVRPVEQRLLRRHDYLI